MTDLTYQARGRRYGDEDIFLSSRLRKAFSIALSHPRDAASLMDLFDAVVVRNSGPVLHYQAEYDAFRQQALIRGTRVYNTLTGKADMAGKQYLVDLSLGGYPVVPTVDHAGDVFKLPESPRYVVKPKLGADSIGLQIVTETELAELIPEDALIQPLINFRYEVSFYFIDHEFQYALYAPRYDRRWELERFEPNSDDLRFAQTFIDWNTIDRGIQRVDAGRTEDGRLLLIELEDLNPYLSLDILDSKTRDAFITTLTTSIKSMCRPV